MERLRKSPNLLLIFTILLLVLSVISIILPATSATPVTKEFLEDWYETKFTMTVKSEDIWNLPSNYNVTLTIRITDMGYNEYLWLNRIKVSVGFYVEEDLLVDKKLTHVDDTYSTTFILKSDAAFKYLRPGETSTYTLSIDVTGEVKELGYTWSGWTYESFDIKIYSPPAPVSVSTSISPEIIIGNKFNLDVSVTNDGDYSITDVTLELSVFYGLEIIGEKTQEAALLEPKKTAVFTFELKGTSTGKQTISVYTSYKSPGGYEVSGYETTKEATILVISPPAPISISVTIPPQIVLRDRFDVKVSITNDGEYPISDVEVDLLVFGVSVISEHPKTIALLEPKKTETFSFQAEAIIPGDYTMSVHVSYYSYGKEWLTKTKDVKLTISKIPSTITCTVSPEKVSQGDKITIYGSLTPAKKEFIYITFKKPDGTPMETTVLSTVDGEYIFEFKPDLEGPWTVKASWAGDFEHEGATSPVVSFTVEKRGCIIATSTYGSELAAEVQFLREFRENTVYSTQAGTQFMRVFNAWYYSFSPTIAEFISSHEMVKPAMRFILYPLLQILHLSTVTYSTFSFNSEVGIVIAGLVSSALIGAIYFSPLTILTLLPIQRYRKSMPKVSQLRPLLVLWLANIAFIFIGEVSASPILLKITTGAFVVFTIALCAGAIALKTLSLRKK